VRVGVFVSVGIGDGVRLGEEVGEGVFVAVTVGAEVEVSVAVCELVGEAVRLGRGVGVRSGAVCCFCPRLHACANIIKIRIIK
jgi:hypothetical protein